MPTPYSNTSSKPSFSCFFFSFLFVCILLLPAIVGYLGILNHTPTPHFKIKPPAIQLKNLFEQAYYRAWEDYITRRFLTNELFTTTKRRLDYRLFNMTDSPDIYVGRDGWLFPQNDIDALRKGACAEKERIDQLIFELETIDHLIEKSGRKFLFSIVPEKTTIYPEKIGRLPRQSCDETLYDIFLKEQGGDLLNCFVRLDILLSDAKSEDISPYAKAGVGLNAQGTTIAAKALIQRITQPPKDYSSPDKYLEDLMIGGASQYDTKGVTDQPRRQTSSAVVYGGTSMTSLLPDLSRLFKRIEAITAESIPSTTYKEDISSYDTILVVIDESQLEALHFDFAAVSRMLGIDDLAVSEIQIPFNAVVPGDRLSLDQRQNHVAVKSLGADSFFTISVAPGSDEETLRMLAINVAAPNVDILSLHSTFSPGVITKKSLGPEGAWVYLPLPMRSVIPVQIYPGRTTGIFTISEIKILEYQTNLSPRMLHNRRRAADTRSAPALIDETMSVQSIAPLKLIESDIATSSVIKLNDFHDLRVFQRRGNTASVMVSGTYNGHPKAIEASVIQAENGVGVTPWQIIDESPSNGVFMGTLTDIPQGGWYHVVVRFTDIPQISDRGLSRWGIGVLIGCIGQSNMKEWFYAGTDAIAHPLLSRYREGQWQPMTQQGNGAITLGNRLIEKLGVPVGLLDYAVNGSGLCKEADWGAGYWTDRTDTSIYKSFIKDVAAIGGSLEYVIWMQGEADAARATVTESQYRNTLKTFINQQIRHDIFNGSNQPNLPFLIINMVKRPIGKDEPHQAIRSALSAVAKETEDCYLAAVSLDLKTLGRQHLSSEAYTTLGLRTAQTILFLLGKENYYRGPSIVAAEKITETLLRVHIAHQGGFDFSPAANISGWDAIQGDEPIPIIDVQRENAKSVLIVLGHPVKGSMGLRYLYGARPDTSRAIHDNSSLKLPLEPAQLQVH